MYGSTEKAWLRTRIWPSPTSGTAVSRSAKSAGVGQPCGRATRCHSRPVAGSADMSAILQLAWARMPRARPFNTSDAETMMPLDISCCQAIGYPGSMTARADSLTVEVVDLIGTVVARYYEEYEHAAAEHSLTGAQARVLSLLTVEPLPMRKVAERLK